MIYIILILLILQNVQNANAKKSMCKPRAWEPKAPQGYIKGAVSRNSAKLGNYIMPVKLRET